jgi:NADH:ubiquinone reductase (H+-translocating)
MWVKNIDLTAKRVTVAHGRQRHAHELNYDYLVIALWSTTNFFGMAGLEHRALTIKSTVTATLRDKSSDKCPSLC